MTRACRDTCKERRRTLRTSKAAAGLSPWLDPAHSFDASAGGVAMDLAQVFLFIVGWIFVGAWGMVLAAASVIAFGRDILQTAQRATAEKERS